MFDGCINLETLDLRNLDLIDAANIDSIFMNCIKLREITIGSKFSGSAGLPHLKDNIIPQGDGTGIYKYIDGENYFNYSDYEYTLEDGYWYNTKPGEFFLEDVKIQGSDGYWYNVATGESYECNSWYIATGGISYKYGTVPIPPSGEIATYSAIPVYKVTFDANGGTIYDRGDTTKSTIYKYGDTYGKSALGEDKNFPSAVRAGYNFLGWYTSGDEVLEKISTDTVTKTETLYAKWEESDEAIAIIQGTSTEQTLTFLRPEKLTKEGSNSYTYNGEGIIEIYRGIEKSDYSASESTVPWYSRRDKITKVAVDGIVSPISTCNWFRGFSKLKEVDLNGLDTSKTTTMGWMFFECTNLTSLDVSMLNTSSVKDMYAMFSECKNLQTLVANGEFIKETGDNLLMKQMFQECESLTTIDLSSWNTSNVKTMENMFIGCINLKTLNLENWKFAPTCALMFSECYELNDLKLGEEIDTSKTTNMKGMFTACKSLTTLDLSKFDMTNVSLTSDMFSGCIKLQEVTLGEKFKWVENDETVYLPKQTDTTIIPGADGKWYDLIHDEGFEPKDVPIPAQGSGEITYYAKPVYKVTFDANGGNIYDVNDTTTSRIYKYGDKYGYRSGEDTSAESTILPIAEREGYDFVGWFASGDEVVERISTDLVNKTETLYAKWKEASEGVAILQGTMNDYTLTFLKLDQLTLESGGYYTYNGKTPINIYRDIENTDFSGGERTVPWYSVREEIKKVVVEGNISPKSTCNWFNGCTALKEVDLKGLNTSKTTTMEYMFYECSNLEILDVSMLNTSRVQRMHSMFSGCKNLKTLIADGKFMKETDINATMDCMFLDCESLTSLDLSSWNTTNIVTMENMFLKCSNLETINLGNWKFAPDCDLMFSKCINLNNIEFGNEIDTSNTTTMEAMFSDCNSLISLDLSNFTISTETDMQDMFSECYKLEEVTLGEKFAWVGSENYYLPKPGSAHITGADGYWYNIETAERWAPEEIPEYKAATYSAIPVYKVTFDANEGNIYNLGDTTTKRMIKLGSTYSSISMPTATREGYTFDGWYTEKTGGTKIEDTTIVEYDEDRLLTVYARWK